MSWSPNAINFGDMCHHWHAWYPAKGRILFSEAKLTLRKGFGTSICEGWKQWAACLALRHALWSPSGSFFRRIGSGNIYWGQGYQDSCWNSGKRACGRNLERMGQRWSPRKIDRITRKEEMKATFAFVFLLREASKSMQQNITWSYFVPAILEISYRTSKTSLLVTFHLLSVRSLSLIIMLLGILTVCLRCFSGQILCFLHRTGIYNGCYIRLVFILSIISMTRFPPHRCLNQWA